MAVCSGTKRSGEPCTLPAMAGSDWCYNHDPVNAEERRKSSSHAARAKHSSLGRDLRDIRELIRELLGVLLSGDLALGVRRRSRT